MCSFYSKNLSISGMVRENLSVDTSFDVILWNKVHATRYHTFCCTANSSNTFRKLWKGGKRFLHIQFCIRSLKKNFYRLENPSKLSFSFHLFFRQSWTLVLLGHFPVYPGPTPPLTPQTMLDACIQKFFRVSTLYRVGEGRTARKFRKGCTVLRGNREKTEKYEYCNTAPGSFV